MGDTKVPLSDVLLWVAGGRDFTDGEWMRRELITYHGWVLITGAARGADLIAERVWQSMDRPYVGVPARWAALGKRAGVARNESIASYWSPRRLLVFPGGVGTDHASRMARRYEIEIVEATR